MTENDHRQSLGRDSLLERGKRAVSMPCFPRLSFLSSSDIRDLVWILEFGLVGIVGDTLLLIEFFSR